MISKNLELALASQEKYSQAALNLLDYLAEGFPIEEFEEWVRERKFVIGNGYILEFLEEHRQKRENINTSPQAEHE